MMTNPGGPLPQRPVKQLMMVLVRELILVRMKTRAGCLMFRVPSRLLVLTVTALQFRTTYEGTLLQLL